MPTSWAVPRQHYIPTPFLHSPGDLSMSICEDEVTLMSKQVEVY